MHPAIEYIKGKEDSVKREEETREGRIFCLVCRPSDTKAARRPRVRFSPRGIELDAPRKLLERVY